MVHCGVHAAVRRRILLVEPDNSVWNPGGAPLSSEKGIDEADEFGGVSLESNNVLTIDLPYRPHGPLRERTRSYKR